MDVTKFLKGVLLASMGYQFLIHPTAQAQPRAYFDFEKESDDLIMSVDGKEYESTFFQGFTGHKEAFQSNREAYEQMAKAEENWKLGTSLLWGLGVATPLVFSAATVDSGMSATVRGTIYWGSLLTGVITGIHYNTKASRQFLRGFNIYNGVYEKNTKASRWEIQPVIGKSTGIGFAFHY